ncbi:mediator of DNA damage checkpoint protein 1 isoform X2 [Physeter macrocephalus]|uniref:Mediator of DNA damage checkpoint protein 1 n=1 Tax=Physeter macrocephalus TaxID=9755 RepID=A0A455AT71_PHYMC|nr:mediator of DNA damage checkpoint protein 1 isoform X2 [Physeter catodon]XP_028335076.1 mediator of DNA damage checkpoint protein 1 isoform X2 [Physeter catodon]|eukprot:XP_028335075.1 mediator of DNA damage checkpoint protein 1 isoform X3 [Physeter catodon]
MEDTQVINWEVEEEEEVEERPSESLRCSLEPLGQLHIFSSSYGPEKDFPLYLGKNVVGRMPDCSVALPYSSISKQHAVIEILAWDKAPVLRDCGSLNGTQILRPPKVLGPGVSHRLRDRELILFADLPCQYHRLDVPLPFVSRGPLTVEETPRVQRGTQPHRLLLAEDSEEEIDSLSEKCVVKGPRTSFLATVVPESDEEGPSSALDGPGPPFAFNLNSDTVEGESQQPGAGEGSSAARRVTAAEPEQPKPVTTEIQLEKDQCSVKEKNNDTKVERNARSGVVPVGVILERSQPAGEDSDTDVDDESGPLRRLTGVHLERAQPCGFIDSDTDVEEEGIPATPAVVPVRKRHIVHEVGTESPRAPGVAHRQESPAGSDTDIEEGEAPLTVSLDRSQASIVIDSNTDDKEEVSAALTLAHLRESQAIVWNRDPDAEEDRAQPVALLERSQASAGRDSDTDVKEKGLPVEKTRTVPRGHTGKAYSEKSQPPLRDSDTEVTEEKSSPGFHLERSQASATVHVNTQVVEEVPPGPAVILLEKHQVPVAWTHQTDVEAEGGPAKLPVVYLEEARPPLAADCDPDAEENTSLAASAVADVRKSQLQAEDTGTEWAAAVLEQGRAFMAGAQGGSPVAQVEQDLLPVSVNNIADLVVDTGTPGEPTQPQRGGAQTPTEREREPHVDRTMDSGDNHDVLKPGKSKIPADSVSDSEDLDLQATQCFVERENQSLEVPSMEDEPTQAFLFPLPQEPGPSHCSFQATGSLDEPWEVLATQPFCPRESEASETQPIATHIEAHGSCPSPPTAAPQEQHPESPVHAEPLGIQGRGMQTVEEDMGYLNCKMPPAEKASRGDQESPDACRPPAVQEASAPLQNPLISQSQKHPAPQSLLSPSPPPLETPIPRTRQNESQEALETPFSSELDSLHPKPKVKPQGSSPVSSVPLEPHPTASTDQPVTPKPTSRATRGRTQRASVKTPEPVIATAPAPQPSTSTDQPVTPRPTSRATQGRTLRSAAKSPEPVVPITPEPQPSTSKDQSLTPEPTSQATRGRTHRSSVKTSQPTEPTATDLEPSSPTDQPVTPKPTSRATRGRTQRASVKTPEPVISTAPAPQPSTSTDQPVTPKPTSRATRGRTQRASVKTPEPVISTAPAPQPSTSTDQPVTPKPTSRATRGRTQRASVKTPEPVISTAPAPQPSTSTDQPVTPKPTSRATRGRTQRASVKTPEPVISTAPAPQPSTSTDQPVTPKPTSRATRGRTQRASVKTPEPVISTAPAPQPSTSTDQPVTPKPTSRATQGRTLRSAAKSPEPVVPITPEPQPSTSKDQSLTPEPTSQATRGRTHRSSVKTSQPTEPTATDLEPSSPTDQPVTPKVIAQGGQSRTLRSSTVSAVPVPTTPEFHSPVPTGQPVPPEPIPEANCSRRPRATRKHGSVTAHVHEPYSAPSEPNSWSSKNQKRGAVRAAKSLSTIPEPAFAQLPEAPTHATQIPKGEAADRSGFTPEPQPEASQNRKRPLATADSPPLQKRLQRGEVPQKTAFLKEEEENPAAKLRKEEDVVIPGPGKRKREQTDGEPREIPSRSLRRTKPIQESTAPKVLFTGVVDAHGERAVLALGGSLASSVAEASHLVTDRIRRTVKFLCALGRGIPILSLDWLHQSRKAGCFLPPAEYVVTDPEQEKNFGFSLREALSRARERRLLEGYEIHVTPGVQPPPPQMGEIISCCGGTVLPSMPRFYKPQRVVITCSQDFPRCAIPFRVGLPILSPEFLLTGVLKQEAKPEAFVLSTLEMSST